MYQASRLKEHLLAVHVAFPSRWAWPGFSALLLTEGSTGPEETGDWAVGGGGRCVTAAQRNCGGALQETRPDKCAEEEAGGGETVSY